MTVLILVLILIVVAVDNIALIIVYGVCIVIILDYVALCWRWQIHLL